MGNDLVRDSAGVAPDARWIKHDGAVVALGLRRVESVRVEQWS